MFWSVLFSVICVPMPRTVADMEKALLKEYVLNKLMFIGSKIDFDHSKVLNGLEPRYPNGET